MTITVGSKVHYVDHEKVHDDYYGIVESPYGTDFRTNWYFPDGFKTWTINNPGRLVLVETMEAPSGVSTQLSDGGPTVYYDWPSGWNTLNDFIEHKSLHQWKEHSFHWGNVVKALTRWGDKDGTTKEYDAKKVIYSGCRVLRAIIGVENLRTYLQKLLDDPQFQTKGTD